MHTCFHLPRRSTIKATARGPTRVAILSFSLSLTLPLSSTPPREWVYENKSRRAPAITRGRLRRLLICLATRSSPFLLLLLFLLQLSAEETRRRANLDFREFARKFTREMETTAPLNGTRDHFLPRAPIVNPFRGGKCARFPAADASFLEQNRGSRFRPAGT